MLEKFKRDWARFRRSPPGQRFQQRYQQKQRSRRSTLRKVLVMGTGVLIFLVGILLLIFPGPGTVLLVIGGSLIAEDSLVMARALDWVELRLRHLYATTLQRWKRASPGTRALVVICALIIVTSLAFGAYQMAGG